MSGSGGWRKRAAEIWRELARPVDYPQSEEEWLALIDHPVTLSGPFDWGVAIGSVRTESGSRRRSSLGSLLWSFKHRDDDQAAEILAAVLARFLARCELDGAYDGMLVVPPSYQSRPGPPVESLLTNSDRALPIPLWTDMVKRNVAMSPQRDELAAAGSISRDEELFSVDAKVSGKRVLVVDDFYNTGETIGALVHALRAQGAAKVGVVVICSAPERRDD